MRFLSLSSIIKLIFFHSFFSGKMEKDISKIKQKYEPKLFSYPNVVGVAVGFRQKNGKYTKEKCIVVYVKKKVKDKNLKEDEIIPKLLDGVFVDVQETCEFWAY